MPTEQYLFHQYRQYPGNFSREGSRPHQHPFWQLEYITGGVGIFYCNNLNWQFGEGDVIIIPPCNPHNFEYRGEKNSWLSVKFSSDCIMEAPMHFHNDKILLPTMAVIMETFTPAFFSMDSALAVVNSVLNVIVNYCQMQLQEEKNTQSAFVRQALQYIYDQQGNYIAVEELGEALGYSGKYVSARFKNETGIPLKEFIDHQRGEYAARLLKTSNASLTEIAKKLDFRDVYAFSRFFRRTVGETLSAFRRKKLDAR